MLDFVNNWHFAEVATLFGMIALVSSASIAISSQYKIAGARADESPSSFRERNACLMCGGWLMNVSPVSNPSSVLKVLTTFDAGGAVAEIDQASSRTGLGSWNYEGKDHHQVVFTFLQHQITANSYVGMLQITHHIVLNPAFDEFSGYSNFTTFFLDGKATQFERVAELHGFRIKADVPVGTKAAPNIP